MQMMSIRRYLSLHLFAITVLAMIVLTLFKVYWLDPQVKVDANHRQQLVSDVLSSQIKIYLSTAAMQLEGIAALTQEKNTDWLTLEQALNAQVNISGFLDAAYIADMTGKIGAVGLPAINKYRYAEFQQKNISHTALFKHAIQSEKTVWSDSFDAGVNKELFIRFAIPTQSRIVIGEINLDKMWLNLEKAAEGSNRVILVLDKQGKVLLGQHNIFFNQPPNLSGNPAISQALESKLATPITISNQENSIQGVITPVVNTNLLVAYAEPVDINNAASHSIIVTSIVFLLIIFVLGVISVLFISKKITCQFSAMANLASCVASGISGLEACVPKLFISEFAHLTDNIKKTAFLLSQQERKMQELISHLPGMIYRVRHDNTHEAGFLSEECINLLGYANTELQADGLAPLRKLIPDNDLAHADQVKQACIDENKPWQLIYRVTGEDGALRYVNDCGRGVLDTENNAMYQEGFITDITEKKRFEIEKSISESRIHMLLNNLPVVLSVVDEKGTLTLCEGQGLKEIGLNAEEMVGKSIFENYAQFPEILANFERCLQGERTNGQAKINGHWYELIYEPIWDQEGQAAGAIMIQFDISIRKNAELKLHSISSLLAKTQSMTQIGAWSIDFLTNEIYWSDKTYQIHGVSQQAFTPSLDNFLEQFTPESRALIAAANEAALLNGEGRELELSLTTPAGEIRHVKAVNEVIVEGGQVIRMLGAIQDITDFKQTENELRTHQQHLKELVEQRTLELVIARDAAENAARAKSYLLANTSHEIRTPINAILGFTRLALNTTLTPKQRNYLEKANISSNLLLNLINGILDFSKIEAGQLELATAEFTLAEVLEKVSTVTTHHAHKKGLEYLLDISTDVNQILVGDPMRLSQVLINLCSNAVKFTHHGQIVLSVVTCPAHEAAAMTLEFTVRDSGIGMSELEMSKLFKPFSQVDNSNTRRYGGTGLGLVISQQLVEMMGGHIWAESTPNVGSTFKFTARFSKDAQALSPLNYPIVLGLKALVVDASASSCDIHSAQLASLGYETTSVSSLAEARDQLRAIEDKSYDFVLLDGKLTQGQAQCIAELKATQASKVPRIILMIEDTEIDTHPDVLAAIDSYSGKPALAPQLLDAVMKAFGCHRRLSPVTSKQMADTALPDEALRGCRVLLVEDNDFNQEVVNEILQDAGIVTTIANNGQEAIDLAMKQPFDLVLMDIQMPVMDGLDATMRLRSEPRLQQLPIIAMTAHALVDEQNQCMAVGMNDFLSKPVDPKTLLSTMARWIMPNTPLPPQEVARSEHAVSATSVSPADCLPGSITGISLEAGLNYSGGNVTFYLKMLRKFLDSKSAAAQDIQAHINLGDLETARRIAHTHKSISGHIGAENLSAAAAALEKSLREGETESIQARLREFTQHNDMVINGLHLALEHHAQFGAQPATETSMNIPDQLRQLADLLPKDIGKALKLERELRPHMEKSPLAEEFMLFQKYLRAWDTSAAAEALQQLIAYVDVDVESGIS